jgi:hypothetical protein
MPAYKSYIALNEKGEKLPRKQRKSDRRNVFTHNKKEHSRRVKRVRKEEKLEAELAKQQEAEQEGTGTEATA